MVEVWIAEELFYYAYPFLLPGLLSGKLKKFELEVQSCVIQNFSSITVKKIFDVKTFIENYPTKLSNKKIAKIKRYLISIIEILESNDLIEPTYQIFKNGELSYTKKLTSRNISEGFIVNLI